MPADKTEDDQAEENRLQAGGDRVGNDFSRGPNPAPGGETDVEDRGIPPYEGRTGTEGNPGNDELRASVERQMVGAESGTAGQTASPAVESPARQDELTDDVPESAKGVGVSVGRRGEEMSDGDGKEAGRDDAGDHPDSGRPTGTSDERDHTGV
ncbi:MAG: hypothetical protein M3527_00685 [Actinomycetota bacterium]|nr:hypothetical protein [Acidimicrobiia bacterium]MDQ3292958.1 hypothetical protein [Actinomycetota bacterium]